MSFRSRWVFFAVLLLSVPALAGVMRVHPIVPGDPPASSQKRPVNRRINLGSSNRQLLASTKGRGGSTALRVLGIRVEFPPPREEDGCGISGTGKFDLSGEDSENRELSAPPHNKRYFENTLEALSRYYAFQSYGKVEIVSRVVPDVSDSAYLMPRRTAYYGYYIDPFDLMKREARLADLLADAIELADSDSSVRLADYDSYIIFHAGGDWQHDYAGDSPCDPITAYIPSLSHFLGEPLSVDGGSHLVDDGIIMPEAIDQDLDSSEAVSLIISELVHEFGHQLGLLDLYYVNDFSNCVGYWALMDNGDGVAFQDENGRIVTGVLPPSMCIYSKEQLGWIEPLELEVEGIYSVWANSMASSGYKATISDTEYFLVENREIDTDGDEQIYLKTESGVVLGPTTAEGDSTTSEYDAGLPGSGVLIWHIDTSVEPWANAPNSLWYDSSADTLVRSRGVALEEASGFENLGFQWWETNSAPEGTESADPRGMPDDPFRAGNNTSFGDDTKPSSRDNRGRRTHIEISSISESGPEMAFFFNRTWAQAGWPVVVAQGPLTIPTVAVNKDGDQIIVVAGRGEVFAYTSDGEVLDTLWDSRQQVIHPPAAFSVEDERECIIAASAEGGRLALLALSGSESGGLLDGWPQSPTGRALSTPVLLDFDHDGLIEVAVGSSDGKACLLGEDGEFLTGWPVALGDGEVGSPAVADIDGDNVVDLIFPLLGSGLFALDIEGNALTGWPSLEAEEIISEPLIGDFEGDGEVEIFVVSRNSAWLLDRTGEPRQGWPVEPDTELGASTAIADLDGDGYLDAVAVDRGGGVWGWSRNGRLIEDCYGRSAGTLQLPGGGLLLCPDVDGDDESEFLVGAGDLVKLTEGSGRLFPGWPLSIEAMVGGILADIDGDLDLEFVIADSSGSLSVWDLPYEEIEGGWLLPRGDNAMTGWAGVGVLKTWAGSKIVSKDEFYCWPSPVLGTEAHFSFKAMQGATITLTVMDAAGNRRAEWDGMATGGSDEWFWSVSVPTGVYFCKLEAGHDGDFQRLIHQFSVVRQGG